MLLTMKIETTFIVMLLAMRAPSPFFGATLPVSEVIQEVQSSQASEQLQKDKQEQKNQNQHKKEAARQDAKNEKSALKPPPTSQKLPESLKKHRSKHRPANPSTAEPQKTVVRQGSAPDPKAEISPGIPPVQASHEILSTNELLSATDDNLKKISGRSLNSSQQEMLTQVHSYLQQAKSAAEAGDLQRSQNLAFKAHLLSDELAQH